MFKHMDFASQGQPPFKSLPVGEHLPMLPQKLSFPVYDKTGIVALSIPFIIFCCGKKHIRFIPSGKKQVPGQLLFRKGRKLPIVVMEEISLKRRFRRNDPVCSAGNCLSRRRNDTFSVSCFRSFRHIQMKKCDLHFSPFYTCINFIQIYFNTILYQKYIFRQNFIIFSDSYSIWSALFIPPC